MRKKQGKKVGKQLAHRLPSFVTFGAFILIGGSLVLYLLGPILNILRFDTGSQEGFELIEIDRFFEDVPSNYDTPELEILPNGYEELIRTLGEDLSQHEKTILLSHAQTTHPSDQDTLTSGYDHLVTDGQKILIPQAYIDNYFIKRLLSIADAMQGLAISVEQRKELKNIISFDTSRYIDRCNTTDLEVILDRSTQSCTAEPDKTIGSVCDDLVFSSQYQIGSGSNEFTDLISRNLYLYSLYQSPEVLEAGPNHPVTIPEFYLDIQSSHLLQIDQMIRFLDSIYTQMGVNDTSVELSLSDLKTELKGLRSYTEEPANIELPDRLYTLISRIITSPTLDLPEKVVPSLETVSWYAKTIDLNDKQQIYVAPIYIFKDTTEDQLLTYTINDDNFNSGYDVEPTPQKNGSVRVPILMYHHIAEIPEGGSQFVKGLYVSPSDFEKQLAYLVKNNYKTLSPKELYEQINSGQNPTQKCVVLTFDDGTVSHYATAFPLLKKYGLSGVFYVVSTRSSITTTQLIEMSDSGMYIESHSTTHKDLTKVTDIEQLTYEISASKGGLTSLTGQTVTSIAYPGCVATSTVFQLVAEAGYLTGTSCGKNIDHYPNQRLSLARVHVDSDMESFLNILSGNR